MKVAYVLTFDPTVNSGLWLRLTERLEVWAQQGLDVDVIIAARRDSPLTTPPLIGPHRLHLLTSNSSFSASHKLPQIMQVVKPDIVYMRYNLPYPGMIQVSRSWATVLEVHADDTLEWRHRPLRYRYLAKLLRGHLLKNIEGLVLVDPEMRNSSNFPVHEVPTLILPNGIKISSIEQYGKPRLRADGPPRFAMAVGNSEPWHGLDKFADIARLMPECEFSVIGTSGAVNQATQNLRFDGRVDAADVMKLLHMVDFGIGNLALERIHRRKPSPLKVREYISAGLPCILAHEDPDLGDTDGVLQLPYGFSPNLQVASQIRAFATRWTGKSCPLDMAMSVDVVAKEKKRLAFITEIASRGVHA